MKSMRCRFCSAPLAGHLHSALSAAGAAGHATNCQLTPAHIRVAAAVLTSINADLLRLPTTETHRGKSESTIIKMGISLTELSASIVSALVQDPITAVDWNSEATAELAITRERHGTGA